MQAKKKVVVIGAGAAGLMAAGTAGGRGLNVILVEKNERPGRKLMITGKGRCNLGNAADVQGLIANVPVNGKFLYSAFNAFSSRDLVKLFQDLGLETKVERGGRIFPVSDKAVEVVDALKEYLRRSRVKIKRGEAKGIALEKAAVCGVILKEGQRIAAESVIIATGGLSYPLTGSTGDGYRFARECGHTITPLKPSLVPLEVHEKWVSELQGLTLKNIAVTVYNRAGAVVYKDFGEMLFTHFGLSGPVILSASSFMRDVDREEYTVVIDLKPALFALQLDRRIQRDFTACSRKIFSNSLGGLLPGKMIPVIVNLSGIPGDKPVNQVCREERRRLGFLLKNLKFHVQNLRPVEEAIITSGGVDVREVNPSTMESRLVKGLFFAGEVLDVDAYTGGYNLQIAFSTGYAAGMNC